MKKSEVVIQLEVGFVNEFAIAGGKGAGHIQNTILRDYSGQPYIPGSTIKGAVRRNAVAIEKLYPNIFENYSSILFGGEGNQSGELYFDNLMLENYDNFITPPTIRAGVSISRHTKVKIENRLFFKETSGDAGQMIFKGEISGMITDYKEKLVVLIAAIKMIVSLGGSQSVGLGWISGGIKTNIFINGDPVPSKEIISWVEEVISQ